MATSTQDKHVMISYSWEKPAQPIMREVKRQLEENGHKVWMDVDGMRGNIYDTMAKAVDNADVVLACITPGYQGSDNCRQELCMAQKKKKLIVPIKVGAFNETGWLETIIAGLLYYKIESEEKVREIIPEIMKAIEEYRMKGRQAAPKPAAAAASEGGAPSIRVEVSERQLNDLARNYPGDESSYLDLAEALGIGANHAMNIRLARQGDPNAAIRACLQMYRDRTGGYRDDLVRILEQVGKSNLQNYL